MIASKLDQPRHREGKAFTIENPVRWQDRRQFRRRRMSLTSSVSPVSTGLLTMRQLTSGLSKKTLPVIELAMVDQGSTTRSGRASAAGVPSSGWRLKIT